MQWLDCLKMEIKMNKNKKNKQIITRLEITIVIVIRVKRASSSHNHTSINYHQRHNALTMLVLLHSLLLYNMLTTTYATIDITNKKTNYQLVI